MLYFDQTIETPTRNRYMREQSRPVKKLQGTTGLQLRVVGTWPLVRNRRGTGTKDTDRISTNGLL